MVFERQPIGRAGAQVRIELPAISAVGIASGRGSPDASPARA
jgi:hypothetical protein